MRVARQRQRLTGSAIETDPCNFTIHNGEFAELGFQPQPRRDQDLIIAAAPGVHLAANITQALGQTRLDRRVAIFVALVEDKNSLVEICRKCIEFMCKLSRLVGVEHTDTREPFDMRLACLYVVQEKFAIEQYVVSGKETHDARIDLHPRFLPEQITHVRSPPVRPTPTPDSDSAAPGLPRP